MNKTLPALPGKASALPPGAFEIGYTAHDGAQHRYRLPRRPWCGSRTRSRRAASAPARGSGICQGAGRGLRFPGDLPDLNYLTESTTGAAGSARPASRRTMPDAAVLRNRH